LIHTRQTARGLGPQQPVLGQSRLFTVNFSPVTGMMPAVSVGDVDWDRSCAALHSAKLFTRLSHKRVLRSRAKQKTPDFAGSGVSWFCGLTMQR